VTHQERSALFGLTPITLYSIHDSFIEHFPCEQYNYMIGFTYE